MLSDWFCLHRVPSLWLGQWNRGQSQNGHSDSEVGGRKSDSPYYDSVLYTNSRLLHSTVKKWKSIKRRQVLSPGSEVLTTLNHLSVTRSWNWSTWANGELSKSVQHKRQLGILGWFLRTGTRTRVRASRPDCGGWWKCHHSIWRVKAEVLPSTTTRTGSSPLLLTILLLTKVHLY